MGDIKFSLIKKNKWNFYDPRFSVPTDLFTVERCKYVGRYVIAAYTAVAKSDIALIEQ